MSAQLINDQLAQLKVAREASAQYRAEMKAMLDHAKATPNFALAMEQAEKADAAMSEIESRIRTLALDAFALDQNRHPHEKVDIKIFTEAVVVDTAAARDWAFENLPAALKLDEAKVKKYAKDFGEVPGVEIKTEPRAQIATQL